MTRNKAYDAGGGAKVHKRDIWNSIAMETSPGDDEDTVKNSTERAQNGSHLWKHLEVFDGMKLYTDGFMGWKSPNMCMTD